MKIYTKNGDKGYTKNILGEAIKKSDDMLELQGSVDEVNATIGYLRSILSGESDEIDQLLRAIQYTVFKLGSDVTYNFTKQLVTEADVKRLEEAIDCMTGELEQQTSFLYYSGHSTATYTQIIRSVVRRAERAFVRYYKGSTYPVDMQYLNRLADYFYVLARYLNHRYNIKEEKMIIESSE